MVVRRRGGSQDYIPGGSAENSRAPLRGAELAARREGRQEAEPAAHAGKPTCVPRLETQGKGDWGKAEGLQPPASPRRGGCAAEGTRNPSGEAGTERRARQQTVPLVRHASSGVWHRQNRPLAEPPPSPRCCCCRPRRVGTGELAADRPAAPASSRLRGARAAASDGAAEQRAPGKRQLQSSIVRPRSTRVRERLPPRAASASRSAPSPSPGAGGGFPALCG